MPGVGARLVRQHPWRVGLRRVLQVVVEKGLHHLTPEPACGIARELDHPDAASLATPLPVIPGTEHEMNLLAFRILGCERLVKRWGAIDVFLVEEPADDHHRHGDRLFREQPVDRLLLPPGVISRVRRQLPPEAGLLQAVRSRHRPRGATAQPGVVTVVGFAPPLLAAATCRLLVVSKLERALGAKSAVVEPVVAHPSVDHGRERHGCLESRMRIHRRHDGRVAFVGAADSAHASIALAHVLHQPFDRVVAVSRVVGRRLI